jgi:hypothetical protein
MTECFWCYCQYDNTKIARCPDCQSETNTREITIIKEKGDSDD